jgi:hypothetical protein
MGKWLHRLSDIDTENKTALCSNCGKVKIRKKGQQFRCSLAVQEYRRVNGNRHRYHEPNPGVCTLCGNNKRVAYDHNHKNGEFRGWLCINCNTVLGLVHDNPQRLRELADYLDS